MTKILLNIRALWLRIPEALAHALRDSLMAGVTAIIVLNLGIPNTLDEAKAEMLLAISVAAPAIYAVIRKEVVPWIVNEWLKAA